MKIIHEVLSFHSDPSGIIWKWKKYSPKPLAKSCGLAHQINCLERIARWPSAQQGKFPPQPVAYSGNQRPSEVSHQSQSFHGVG